MFAASPPTLNELKAALARPEAYVEPTTRVETIETHISVVFLTDQFAYKLKKPVRYDFLDFSTLAKREAVCRDELRLNRRLAADVYLDVVPVVRRADAAIAVGGSGETIDWLVKMRRLDDEQTLRAALVQKQVPQEAVESLTETLAGFYRALSPETTSPRAFRSEIEAHVRGNLAELVRPEHQFDVHQVKRTHNAQLEQLLLRPAMFDARVSAGRVIDGHGDLRPEHIYLTEPPVAIDCIEFSAEFRRLDVLDELCFLESECAELGDEAVGKSVRRLCLELLGDAPPESLAAFYKSYRACVRAKVAALRARQQQGADRAASLKLAREYLRLADRFDQRLSPPLVILVRGVSGTGKSTLATALANLLAAEHLQTDELRTEMEAEWALPIESTDARYSQASRERVYDVMFERARLLLANRSSVILDGTFLSAARRQQAEQLAKDHGAIFQTFRCVCPSDIAAARVARRRAAGTSPSEAYPELVARQLAADEPDSEGLPSIDIDTSQPVEQLVAKCVQALQVHIAIPDLR
ncbi:MAG TPA: AAA family ATPase [Pirellulaceae bacterium]|nr:AAA family ATPase [Pirellulaceae bacterium]